MAGKTYLPAGQDAPASQIGATLDALSATIAARRDAGEESYTHRLLEDSPDAVLKKVMEESGEVALAAKDVECRRAAGEDEDAALDHLRYESADVVYHLLVVLERYGIGIEEFAAELNERMTDEERPEGAVRLQKEHVNRGK